VEDTYPDFSFWKIGFRKEFKKINYEVYYFQSNLDKQECDGDDDCETQLVFSISREF